MIYLDSSAIVKLAHHERESVALRTWLAEMQHPLVTSALARTECGRALRRTEMAALPTLAAVLATIHQAPITDTILDAAATMLGASLRSLDAIHLATAVELAASVFVAYDKRLIEAAAQRGLPVAVPT